MTHSTLCRNGLILLHGCSESALHTKQQEAEVLTKEQDQEQTDFFVDLRALCKDLAYLAHSNLKRIITLPYCMPFMT